MTNLNYHEGSYILQERYAIQLVNNVYTVHQGLFCKHKDRRGSLVTKSYKWESSVTCALIEAYNHLSQYDTAGSSNEWDLKPAVREID